MDEADGQQIPRKICWQKANDNNYEQGEDRRVLLARNDGPLGLDAGGSPPCGERGPRTEPRGGAVRRHAYDELYQLVQADSSYWVSSPEELPAEYRKLMEKWPNITPWAVFNLRGNIIRDKIVRGHFRIKAYRVRRGILKAYKTQTILAVSKEFDYPPRPLLKAIFTWLEVLPEKGIDKLFRSGARDVTAITDKLNQRNLSQYNLAIGCDADPADNSEVALRHEKEFVGLFSSFPHKTEDDLKREGSKTTPDILFTEPIEIDGNEVNWIDYKDYIGLPNTFLTGKLRKQAEKYTTAHGPGAFAFNGGFVEGTEVGALLLNALECPVGKFSPSYYYDAAEEVSTVDGCENARNAAEAAKIEEKDD